MVPSSRCCHESWFSLSSTPSPLGQRTGSASFSILERGNGEEVCFSGNCNIPLKLVVYTCAREVCCANCTLTCNYTRVYVYVCLLMHRCVHEHIYEYAIAVRDSTPPPGCNSFSRELLYLSAFAAVDIITATLKCEREGVHIYIYIYIHIQRTKGKGCTSGATGGQLLEA
ncbi:T. brucei spp.-specific protein [Trypanosoma brucei gambiense DAL972]|uniref:T. brucei spp.-specific protein n=1 Tax=Trypanosoma brucei gambiense (strain MHOM/CI/86/DAL972) TaxID=679716 RepID=C9ZM19_TRYB9|nr:T. brucei spp.-specific protein [Trypanosoma brucei gambiense DAL972]CBH10444.1 T. brucei spp.-specific protein [Trypanosoma brucei gambiense DAL972]|eukprot:XP_011772734.1 T. brucei spp.-specific protein [Trypanosoma brucei gambiense DAL972]